MTLRLRHELVRVLAEAFETELDGGAENRFLSAEMVWLDNPLIREYVLSPRIARICAELLNVQGVRLYHDNVLSKEPGCGRTPWHYDDHHFPLDTHDVVTAWAPAQAIPMAMGPLAFAKPIDVYKLVEAVQFDKSNTSYDRKVAEVFRDNNVAVDDSPFELGEVSFHHNLSFHTAQGNHTNRSRVILANTYYADGARVVDSPTMVSGDWQKFMPGVGPGEVAASELNPVCWPASGDASADGTRHEWHLRTLLRALERGQARRDGGVLRAGDRRLPRAGRGDGLARLAGGRQQAVGDRPLRLLDVACGSGKFPVALAEHAGVGDAAIRPVAYSLLDPSAFSIAEARANLPRPFRPDGEYEVALQDLDCAYGAFDIAWATHALYAIPPHELAAAMGRFLHALGDDGVGRDRAFRGARGTTSASTHFLEAFGGDPAQRYSSAEQVQAALEAHGASVETREIAYENGVPEDARAQVEGFLQRCAFDDRYSLDQMRAREPLASYLAPCLSDRHWRFAQRVQLMFVTRR